MGLIADFSYVFRQRLKREEQQKEKEVKAREQLVKQRLEQRLLSAKKIRMLDIEKCPLLSKPGDMYLKNKIRQKLVPSKEDNVGLNVPSKNSFNLDTTPSQSSFSISSKAMNRSAGSTLRVIYPQTGGKNSHSYERLKMLEHVADIFMCFTLFVRSKFMNHFCFRSFIR